MFIKNACDSYFIFIIGIIFRLFQEFSYFYLVIVHLISSIWTVRYWGDYVMCSCGGSWWVVVLSHPFAQRWKWATMILLMLSLAIRWSRCWSGTCRWRRTAGLRAGRTRRTARWRTGTRTPSLSLLRARLSLLLAFLLLFLIFADIIFSFETLECIQRIQRRC